MMHPLIEALQSEALRVKATLEDVDLTYDPHSWEAVAGDPIIDAISEEAGKALLEEGFMEDHKCICYEIMIDPDFIGDPSIVAMTYAFSVVYEGV